MLEILAGFLGVLVVVQTIEIVRLKMELEDAKDDHDWEDDQ